MANGTGTFEPIKTTTKAMNLFGENSMMLISFTDDSMFIEFRDRVIQPDGRSKYPMAKARFALRPDIAYGLYRAFTKYFIDKMNEGVSYSIGLYTDFAKTNFVQFYTGDDGHSPRLQLIANANVEAKVVCEHVFRSQTLVENWEKDKVSESIDYPSMFVLAKALELYGEHATSMAVAHTVRKANAWANSQNYKLLCDIAMKLGVQMNSYTNQSPSFNPSNSEPSQYQSASSMDALMGSNDELPF